jgi:hypothetical protein
VSPSALAREYQKARAIVRWCCHNSPDPRTLVLSVSGKRPQRVRACANCRLAYQTRLAQLQKISATG